METTVLGILFALYLWALIVTAWKRRWGWFVGGLLISPLAFIGLFLEPEPGSGWPNTSTVMKLGLPVVLVGIAAIVGAVVEGPTKEESAALDRLKPNTEQYAAATGVATPGTPQLSGRIVPIDTDDKEIDEGVYIDLPGELQARSPKEVSTVVLINYETKVVGQYEDGSDAMRDFANLTIVNLASGQQFEGKSIAGPEPNFVKAGGGSAGGGLVDKGNIANYLAHLSP